MKAYRSKNDLPPKSDLEIWDEIKKGDTSALGSLYDIYIDVLFSYGIQCSQDKEYVMDCIHDLFLDLYKYRTRLSATDNVKLYLFKSLRRKINRKYHRKDSPADFLLENDGLPKNQTISCEEDIIRSENAAEKTAKLTTAMKSLTKKQKKGLFLRFDEDRSYEEIAKIMHVTIPTARTTIYRAIKVLRKQALLYIVWACFHFFS